MICTLCKCNSDSLPTQCVNPSPPQSRIVSAHVLACSNFTAANGKNKTRKLQKQINSIMIISFNLLPRRISTIEILWCELSVRWCLTTVHCFMLHVLLTSENTKPNFLWMNSIVVSIWAHSLCLKTRKVCDDGEYFYSKQTNK